MKKIVLSVFLSLGVFLSVNAGVTITQTFFFDFGLAADTTIYTAVGNNNNYWNNYTGVGIGFQGRPLINSLNTVSVYHLAITNTSATIGFTGTNGPSFGPTTNTAALGDLGIASATTSALYAASSVYTTGQLTFSGLNPGKGYKFYLFGSRATATLRQTSYTLTGNTGSTFTEILTTSGTGNVNAVGGVNYNNSKVVQSTLITPTVGGLITLDIATVSGGFCYLNCMKVEEYDLGTTIDKAESKSINVYPSIFDNEITINGATQNVELFNNAGVKIMSQSVKSKTALNTTTLTKGFYILVVDNKVSFKVGKK
jgi:hypothetical protein